MTKMQTRRIDHGIWIDWFRLAAGGRGRCAKFLAWDPLRTRYGRLKLLQDSLAKNAEIGDDDESDKALAVPDGPSAR